MVKVRLNIKLLHYLVQNKLLNSYCYFLKFKYHFSNSLYYNYSLSSFREIHGHTRRTITKLVALFLKRGWCRMEGQHLRFISLSELCSVEGLNVKAFTKATINIKNLRTAKLQLQRLLFEDSLRKQEYVMRRKSDLQNPKTLTAYKSACRWQRQQLPGESSSMLVTTLHKMSKIYNCSITTANRIKQKFKDSRYYDFFRQFSKIASGVSKISYLRAFLAYKPGSLFYFKGTVYKSEPSRVVRLMAGI